MFAVGKAIRTTAGTWPVRGERVNHISILGKRTMRSVCSLCVDSQEGSAWACRESRKKKRTLMGQRPGLMVVTGSEECPTVPEVAVVPWNTRSG
jgi:hypothetical protein